jgi:hydrogenase maturation protease
MSAREPVTAATIAMASTGAEGFESPDLLHSILIAGVGNAWMRDDGFGSAVAQQLTERELPAGVAVMDAGTGGLDLAYEVMRGYDALMILDISRQGGTPGTLYVIEPDEASVSGSIEDGEVINPHGMDPQTVLRFVRSVGAWPGRVVVIACEPAETDQVGWGLSGEVQEAVARATDLVLHTATELLGSPPDSA